MKPILILPCLVAMAFTILPGVAQQARVSIETAPTPAGPWSPLRPSAQSHDGDGNPLVPLDAPRAFYRSRIDTDPSPGDPAEIAAVPARAVELARAYLKAGKESTPSEREGAGETTDWPADAEIVPCVRPVFDLAVNDGKTPAYFEFKVIQPAPPKSQGLFPDGPLDQGDCGRGYILVSLHEGESPVPGAATQGITPTEQLERLAGTGRFKAFRWGSTFITAEDDNGRQLASMGEQPFVHDPAELELLRHDLVWTGDDTTGASTAPPPLPALRHTLPASYAAFRADYLSNPVLQASRQRRQRNVSGAWDLQRNGAASVNVTRLALRQTLTLQSGEPATWQWQTESTTPVLALAADPGGGVRLTAEGLGEGVLLIEQKGVITRYAIQVSAEGPVLRNRAKNFVPGWQPWHTTVIPGGNEEQPAYYQPKRDQWCYYVGCGPLAWAMFFSWWEHHGVPAAWGSPFTITSPPDFSTQARESSAVGELNLLHDYCDTQCWGAFSDQGSTTPANQWEGFLDYTYLNRQLNFTLNASWNVRWAGFFGTLDTEGGGTETRAAVKKGYPSTCGIGEWSHYVLVYGYRWQAFKIAADGPDLLYSREILCNMGWGGGGKKAEWRSLYDVFFSSDIRLKKGLLAPASP